MKGKYLLVVVCMLVSLTSMGQRRKRRAQQQEQEQKTEAPAPVKDSTAAAAHVVDDIIPENTGYICTALVQLMNDATNDFEHTKGKSIETVAAGTRWTSMGGIPGSITSSLLRTPARWQYEGIVYQGNSREDMKEAYEKYKGIFSPCLSAKGYTMSTGKSTSGKSEGYPECKFAKDKEGVKDSKHNPRATINVDYTAGADLYVVTVNVWSN